MNRNDYDRNQCLEFFQAYRDCKKDWVRPCVIRVRPSLNECSVSLTSVTPIGVLDESSHDILTFTDIRIFMFC